MVYLRGHPRDYDNWANITGDGRWSYKNVLPYFLKSEDYCVKCETNPNDAFERKKINDRKYTISKIRANLRVN
jgi:choline dehydrogenase-like flavoprotein